MTTIAIDPNIGQQAAARVLQMHAQGRALPPNPEGFQPGGEYSEAAVETPTGTLRFLYYAAPDGDPVLLGQVPPTN